MGGGFGGRRAMKGGWRLKKEVVGEFWKGGARREAQERGEQKLVATRRNRRRGRIR